MKIPGFIFALLLSCTSQASTLIDFDSQPLGATASPLTIGDFSFNPAGGMEIIQQSPGDNALYKEATGLTDGNGTGTTAGPLVMWMESTSDDPFAFYGADVFGTSLNGTVSLIVIGVVSGGGTAADPIGTGDWLNLEKVFFEVTSGEVYSGFDTLSITIDNVNAGVVPIPAAVWLFASALAGLGWFRRKQTV
jgi:hypothetical protein